MTAISKTSMVSRSHAPRHHGLGGDAPSVGEPCWAGGETSWTTRPDYEGNRSGHHVCRRDALLHHGNVTRGVRRAIAALGAGLVALAIPLVASAHPLLTSSSPAAGARLGTAPGVVVLEFSQFLNARLSHAEVIDPTGHQWPGQVDSAVEMRIPLATNASGVYTVDWTSVSDIDGHVISGSFSFDVGVGASSGTETAALNAIPGPQLSDGAVRGG